MKFDRSNIADTAARPRCGRDAIAGHAEPNDMGIARRRGIATSLASAMLLSLAGCGEVLDIPDNPRLVPPERDPWRCLGKPTQTIPPEGDSATVRVQACNFVSTNCSQPMTGITAKVCDKLDLKCTSPIQTVRDNGGALEFVAPTGGVLGVGFDGYLRITPPVASCTNAAVFGDVGPLLCALAGMACDPTLPDDPDCLFPTFVPALLFFNPSVRADLTTPIPLPLIPTAAAQSLTAAAGGTFNPATGIVFTTSLDCDGVPARDVALTIDKHQDVVTELYAENGVISSTARSTDVTGLGGYIGVPPGFVVLAGYLGSDEDGSARIGQVGVNVEAFTISYTSLVPSE
jgi:hypothetical protein